MKYMVLLYSAEGAWPPDEHRVALQQSIDICHELHAKNQYIHCSPLQPPASSTCVRVRDGKRVVTDGPFIETKEHLAGYFLIEARDLDEAIAIAERIPGSHRGTAEIRPLVEVEGLPATD